MKFSHPLIVLKTIVTFFIWGIVTILFIFVATPFALLPEQYRYHNRCYYFLMHLVSLIIIRTALIKISIQGKENIPLYPNQPSIIVINHTSALDIPLVQMLIGSYQHIWLSKEILSKIPLFGFVLRRMNVLVKKGGLAQSINIVDQAYDIVKEQSCHVLIFPEGMRHTDGKIHKFYSGFAVLAQKLNRPIIPIAIHGLHEIFPKKNILIHSLNNKVAIRIGQPIWYNKTKTKQEFLNIVRQWFIHELEDLSKNF